MTIYKHHVLLVDDSPLNLTILKEFLRHTDYSAVTATSGAQAWDILKDDPDRFDAVLLDRVMPDIDGMEVLRRMKQHAPLSQIPVIMQTAAISSQQMLEGLQAGAYYYLTKPFEEATLLAIVNAAVRDHDNYREVRRELHRATSSMTLLDSATYRFRSPEEAKSLAMLLAHAYPDPQKIVTGILELTLNAVEHGNLSIGYKEKTRLIEEGLLEEEIDRRLADPVYGSRHGIAHFARQAGLLCLQVTDEGAGFDWRKYLDFDPDRAYDTHGRGIAMANKLSFDHIEYRGKGNRVHAVSYLQGATPAASIQTDILDSLPQPKFGT
ncbi:MAG: response regulator [Nitrospira sp. OLB3]|nr:MAG: response regulator [Nitrospira sp. OLB3]RIK61012.1 MAG: response regulator receiver protein [Nitrospira sp.]